MMTKYTIPKEYEPFSDVWVCSNTFKNGRVLIEVDGYPVFLLGRNQSDHESARIWLNTPSRKGGNPVWKASIESSKVLDDRFSVSENEYGQEVEFDGIPILQFKVVNEELIINLINLHPVGLNIVGGIKSLLISGNEVKEGSFSNISTMVVVGQ